MRTFLTIEIRHSEGTVYFSLLCCWSAWWNKFEITI